MPAPAISATIENAPGPGFRDSMAEMHDNLLQEQRDDSWAYMREAELENLLIAETSVGNFRKESIECRATICEVQLSATDERQAAALEKWYEAMNSARPFPLPRDAPLHMRMSSLSKDQGETRVRIFYEKPPPMPDVAGSR